MLKYPIISYMLAYLGKTLVRLLLATCRIEISGLDLFVSAGERRSCIILLWHNRLLIAPEILQRYASQFEYAACISNSRDAEPLAQLVRSYPIGHVIRIPHHSRYEALHAVVAHLKQHMRHMVVITPDGPRGPCYKVKPGAAYAARETGAPIIPLNWNASAFWELKTWDKLKIPKPFSTIKVTFGPVIMLDKSASSSLEQDCLFLKDHLNT